MSLSIEFMLFLITFFSYHQILTRTEGVAITNMQNYKKMDIGGKHLRVILLHVPPMLTVTRNSTGQVIDVTGAFLQILKWFSRDLNFSYSYLDDYARGVENTATSKGIRSYIEERKADYVLGPVIVSIERIKQFGFPYISDIGHFALLIPVPQPSTNLLAVTQPFTKSVWIYLAVSIFVTILGLWLSMRIMTSSSTSTCGGEKSFVTVSSASRYVLAVLLSQGDMIDVGSLPGKQKLVVRFLAGAWCVASFIIVTAYSSVLISFVTAPNLKPLIDSVYDLPIKQNIKLAVDRGWSPEFLFLNAQEGIGKYLGDLLRNNPKLPCNETKECIERVRQGSSVYVMAFQSILNIIGSDLKNNGKCSFTMAKKMFWDIYVGIGMAKDNPYMEDFRKSLLKMREAGLFEFWETQSMAADPTPCLKTRRNSKQSKLTIGGLSGSFIVLSIGIILSLFVFITETFLKCCCNVLAKSANPKG